MPRGILEQAYRSDLEETVAGQLEKAGVAFDYEGVVLEFEIPARKAKYNPDFPIIGCPIILETKGRFGHRGSRKDAAEVRHRLILAKQQNPQADIRLVFQNANYKIYPGSKTTYAKWAEDHGFPWADKGRVPQAWIDEIKTAQRKQSAKGKPRKKR